MNQNKILVSISSIAFSTIVIAFYLQHYLNMQPCPYCIIQRYLFLGIGVFSLISAKILNKTFPVIASFIISLIGLYVAGKHIYILEHPGLSCGIDPVETILNKFYTATYLPSLFKADGLCSDATELILGLSIPQWSLASFFILTLGLGRILLHRYRENSLK